MGGGFAGAQERDFPGNGRVTPNFTNWRMRLLVFWGALLQRHDGILELRSRTPVERDRLRVVFTCRRGRGIIHIPTGNCDCVSSRCLYVVISSEVDCWKLENIASLYDVLGRRYLSLL